MIKVGITGLMGSGKTYISSLFSELGVPIYNSDNRAKWLNNNNVDLKRKIISEFGDVYQNGILDKYKLRNIVFSDGNNLLLDKLNSICHPYVIDDFISFSKEKEDSEYIIVESAILYESNFYLNMDRIIFVDAPYSVRMNRIFKRDGILNKGDVRLREYNDIDKKKMSDFIIINDEKSDCISQVKKINNILKEIC